MVGGAGVKDLSRSQCLPVEPLHSCGVPAGSDWGPSGPDDSEFPSQAVGAVPENSGVQIALQRSFILVCNSAGPPFAQTSGFPFTPGRSWPHASLNKRVCGGPGGLTCRGFLPKLLSVLWDVM